jgi:hypothetical protein
MSVAPGRVSLRSSMCASPSGKPVAQSLSSMRVDCRSIVLQISRLRQAVPDASAPHNPTTHSKRIKQAATDSRRGPRKQKSCSSPAPRSARSLSHGQMVCTYSLDTIRSTTLTRETVTATNDTAGTWRDISLRCKIIIFLLAGRGAVRKVSEVRGSSCHADGAGASSRS